MDFVILLNILKSKYKGYKNIRIYKNLLFRSYDSKYIFLIFIFFTYSLKACEKPTMPSASEWNNWLEDVRNEAKDKNISEKTISLYLSDVKPQEKIILRDRCQPESTITLEEYLYYRVDKSRIIAGRNVLKEHKDILNKISKHFGIQSRFIVAVLGMESFYGRNQGKVDTITAVTTLAFDRRRSDFYRKQLFAL